MIDGELESGLYFRAIAIQIEAALDLADKESDAIVALEYVLAKRLHSLTPNPSRDRIEQGANMARDHILNFMARPEVFDV